MNLSLTLDVAISLIFVYVLTSLLASTVNEMIAGVFRLRGIYLTKAIEEMTSLGKDNQFGWDGLCGWLKTVRAGRPERAAPIDDAAHKIGKAAETAGGLAGATGLSVSTAVQQAITYELTALNAAGQPTDAAAREAARGFLANLNQTIVGLAATAETPKATVLNEILPTAGIANLQNHPLLIGTPSSLPSYVPARDFAAALLGLLKDGSANSAFYQAKAMIDKLPDGDLKTTLQSFIGAGANDIDTFRKRIEDWFDDSMERLSGIYKRFSQWMMLALGLIIAISMNIDWVHMVRTLWNEPTLSHAIADGASEAIKHDPAFSCLAAQGSAGKTDTTTPCPQPNFNAVYDAVKQQQQLPIGWSGATRDFWMVVGWVLSALAISLGAQFWFGLLTQLISLRAAGDKPERANAAPPGA